MEVYAAYADLDDMMLLVEGMYRHICRALHGSEQFTYQGHAIDLAPNFARLPILEGIRQNAGVAPEGTGNAGIRPCRADPPGPAD